MTGRYVLRDDGTIAVLGDDGWPVEIEDLGPMLDSAPDMAALETPVLDVVPVSVHDTEIP